MSDPANLQDLGHPEGHDYEVGSPHLAHPQLKTRILDTVRDVVAARMATTGRARVLELGAGHGAFTDHVLALGAEVTVTEMSSASADLLRRRYEHNPSARVVFDETGECADLTDEQFDVVMCMSVLHHIPDYLSAIKLWMTLLAPGGSFLSFQDPLAYPRRNRANLYIDRGAFYAWRVTRGDLVQGMRSFVRRSRNAYDESNFRDMVEYHVLRDGVDEQAILDLLRPMFGSVELITYWSTQSRLLQKVGDRFDIRTTFGVRASGKNS